MKSILVFLAGLAFAATAGPRCAQEDPPGAQVSVEAVPNETLPALPVAVLITLENRSAEPTPVPSRVAIMQYRTLKITVKAPDGEERRVTPYILKTSHTRFTPALLAPSASVRYKEWVGYGEAGPYFPEPGRYTVEVQVQMSPGVWRRLPPMVILIRKPGGQEAEALKVFPREPLAIDIRQEGVINSQRIDEILPRLERLARQYGDTPYGQYARYILAGHKTRAAKNQARGEGLQPGDADLRDAVELLQRVGADGPPQNLVAEINLQLASYYLRSGDVERAAARLNKLEEQDLPESYERKAAALAATLSERMDQGRSQGGEE